MTQMTILAYCIIKLKCYGVIAIKKRNSLALDIILGDEELTEIKNIAGKYQNRGKGSRKARNFLIQAHLTFYKCLDKKGSLGVAKRNPG
jgi:hypothetical protein